MRDATPIENNRATSVRISCRVSPITKIRAEQAAHALGQTVTHFTEEAIAKRAEEVLAEQNRILLSERDFAAFVEAIDGPPKPLTVGLRAAFANYERGQRTSNPVP